MIEVLLITIIPLNAGLLMHFVKDISARKYKLILALSGAFVMGMCFMHLLPATYNAMISEPRGNVILAGVGVLTGFLIQIGLEWITGGVEHGHVHFDSKKAFPIGLLIGLCLHALIEGLPLNHGHDHDHHLLYSVLVHKFPVAIILVMMLRSFNLSNLKVWLYLGVFTAMAPLGMLITYFLDSIIVDLSFTMMIITSVVIGVLLHISTTILFEASENHKYNATKLLMIIIGFIGAFVTSL